MATTVTGLLLSITIGACASSGTVAHVPVPKPFPMPDSRKAEPGQPAPAADETAEPVAAAASAPASVTEKAAGIFDSYALVGTALDLRGTPYLDGGASPRGFDCSGFTQYVFAQYGVGLPRAVRDQFKVGRTIKPSNLTAGDLVFFTTTDPGASHVAIAVGSDEFIHAPSSTGVVRVERLSASYWSRRFIGARRVR
jgi:cell wall-associated NlpC family hydrolase